MATSHPRSTICPQLIGRAAYLESINSLLAHTRQGHGRTLLVSGEAGIGKSRLITEIRDGIRRDAMLVLQGNCFEPDRTLPFGPLVDMLRALLATTSPASLMRYAEPYAAEFARLLPEIAGQLPDTAISPPPRPEEEKRRLFEAITRILSRLSTRQPLMIVAEDIHWADDTSLEYLAFLARRLRPMPILLLLSYRSDEQHAQLRHFLANLDRERLATEIALSPLAHAEVEEMLHVIFQLQRPVRLEFLDAMYDLTEGNPFFIEEVLHALLADDEIFLTDGGWERKPLNDLHIPRSVQDAVRRRSEHLSPEARQIMAFAAVVGQRFEFSLLQVLTSYSEAILLETLKELIAAQLVVEQSAERFAFRHALTRQAVYAELLERERQSTHRTIAAAIEALHADEIESHLSELAYHTCEAGEWERALEYARRAGERALALYAPHAAFQQFTRTITAAHHLGIPVSPAVYRARARAGETLGDFERARNDLETALWLAHEANDTSTEWAALLDLGLLWAGRDYAKTGEYYRRALELVDTLGQPLKRARTLNRVGNWHLNIDEPMTAKSYHGEALAIFEEHGDEQGMAETLDLLCMAGVLSPDLTNAMKYGERAIALSRRVDDRQTLASTLVTIPFATSLRQSQTMPLSPMTLAEGTQYAENGLRIARAMGWRTGEAWALWGLALNMTASGDFGRGLSSATAALAIASDIEHRQWMTSSRFALGEIAYELYAFTLAREHLEAGLALARAIGSSHWICQHTGLLATTCVAQGDLATAKIALDTVAPPDLTMQTVGQRGAWIARGELALAQGNPEAALAIAERLEQGIADAEQRRMPLVALLHARAFVALGRYDEAEPWLLDTAELLRAQGAYTALRRVLTELATLYRHMGRTDDAQRRVAEARTLIQQLAETIPDTMQRAIFSRQALSALPSLPTGAKHDGDIAGAASQMLTARERQVAALVAEGKSNRAIADELIISERTTESHVTNILGKLGFSSRAQIAAWAVNIGLAHLDLTVRTTPRRAPARQPE